MDNGNPPYRRFGHWIQPIPRDRETPVSPPRDTTADQTLHMFLATESGRWAAPTDTMLAQRSDKPGNYRPPPARKDTALSARDVYIHNRSRAETEDSITTNSTQYYQNYQKETDMYQHEEKTTVLSRDTTTESIVNAEGHNYTGIGITNEHVPNGRVNLLDEQLHVHSAEDGLVKIITKKRHRRQAANKKRSVPIANMDQLTHRPLYLSEGQLRTHTEGTSHKHRETLVNSGTFVKSDIPNEPHTPTNGHEDEPSDGISPKLKHFNNGVEVLVRSDTTGTNEDELQCPTTSSGIGKRAERLTRESTYTKPNGSNRNTETRIESERRRCGNQTKDNARNSMLPNNHSIVTNYFAKQDAVRALRFFEVGHSAPPGLRSNKSIKQPKPYKDERSKTLSHIPIPPTPKKVPFHSFSKASHHEALQILSQSKKSNYVSHLSYENKSGSFYNDKIPRVPGKDMSKPNSRPSLLTFKQTKKLIPNPIMIPSVLEDEDTFVRESTLGAHKEKRIRRVANHGKSPEVSTVMAELYGKIEQTSIDDTDESELAHLREYSELSFYEK